MIGTVIGNFRIVAQLGKGGMGEVWLAEQQSIKTKVAIKLLRDDVSADVSHVQRFFNEAVAVSKIRHAGIVRIFDVGFLDTRAYLVMELLEGETLARRIARVGRLPLREVCDVGRQVAGVLDATHAAGIIHRDLKPENVFLVPDAELPSGERAKVLDFGIAKLGSVGMTSTSVGSMGTPLYMSPEQWRSVAKVDGRTDAYSLGCVVFESACGRPPFPATSMGEACAMHLTEPPPAASSVVPALPPAFDHIVAGLLHKDPAGRPSMKEVMAALDVIAQGLPAAVPFVSGTHGAASPLLSSQPVAAGAATVGTIGAMASPVVAATATGTAATGLSPAVAATADAMTGSVLGPAGAGAAGSRLATGAGAARAATELAEEPGHVRSPVPSHVPSPVTTLGGSAGPAYVAGARRGRARGVIARIAGIAIVAGAAAMAAVFVVRADQASDPQPAAAPPLPPLRADLPIVSPSAVRKLSGEVPQGLPDRVVPQLCIDAAGMVTHAQVPVDVDVDSTISTRVEEKLKTWRYEPFRRDGKAIAVCFSLMPPPLLPIPPLPIPTPASGSGSGKPAPGSGKPTPGPGKPAPGGGSGKPAPGPGSGSGAGSGSGKPEPGDGSGSGKPAPGDGSGSGKPAPGPGSGSGSGSGKPAPGPGSGSGKPAPGPGSGSGGGSGSGKPTPGGGSDSKPPPPPPPPPPATPDKLTEADFKREMKKLEAQMRSCTGRRQTVTVTVRINANGTIQAVSVAPAKQTECVLPKLENVKFPPAKQGGEFKYTYTFNKQ